MEATTFPVAVGGNHQFSTGSPSDLMAYFQQIPVEFTMDDLLLDESGADHAPPDPHSSGDTSNHSTAADAMEVNAGAGQGQGQPVPQLVGHAAPTPTTVAAILDGHTEWDWTEINPDLSQIQVHPHSVGDPTSSFTGAGTEEMMQSRGAQLGFDFNMREVSARPVANAGPARPQPDPYSTGATSRCPSTAAADMRTSSSLGLEVNDGAGLPQSGGDGGGEAPARGSCKRKKPVSGSSSQRSTSELNLVELLDVLVQSDPSSTDIKPPTGSTDPGIIRFLRTERRSMPDGKKFNLSLGEQDQTAPTAVRSYVTTVEMMPDQKTHLGYWKEKQVKYFAAKCFSLTTNQQYKSAAAKINPAEQGDGLKKTFQFHKYDGTKTNWFMHEYIPVRYWGIDLFMEHLRFREVYKGAEVPGDPAFPEVEITNRIATAKKHRMRGPHDLVIKGESPAWQHFIKIYDRHPELEGSKVVYAVCCHCEGVLKAATENGTKSLLNHCDRTCPVKNKNQQPRSSR